MQTIAMESTKRIADQGKRCIVSGLTNADQYRVGDTWYSAKGIDHNTHVGEVRHFGRHTSKVGATIQIVPLIEGQPIQVQILSIRAVNPRLLSAETFAQLGYIDLDDYMADWGATFGERVWLMAIKPLKPNQSEATK